MVQNGIIEKEPEPEVETNHVTITVKDIKTYTVDGNTVFYIVSSDDVYYKGYLKDAEELVFLNVGDCVSIKYSAGERDDLRKIIEVNKTAEE